MGAEIKYARFVDEGENKTLVRLPSVFNQSVIPYNADLHHGSIICDECDAGIYYKPEKKCISGSSKFRASEHFALLPNQRHDLLCRHINPEERIENSLFNSHRDNGYRLHFNPDADLTGTFNSQSIYYRDADKKTRVYQRHIASFGETEKTFMSRSPLSLHSLGDFLDLIQKEDIERLKKSYVVTGTHVVPLNRFIVRPGRTTEEDLNPKFRVLHGMAEQNRITQDGLPRIMEIEFKEPVRPDVSTNYYSAQAKPVFIRQEDNGCKKFVIPKMHVETQGDYRLEDMFREPGKYTVMGLVRSFVLANGSVSLNVRITDLAQYDKRLPSEIFEARKDEIDAARKTSFPEVA